MSKPKEYRICEFKNGNGYIWYQILITKYYLFGLLPIRQYHAKYYCDGDVSEYIRYETKEKAISVIEVMMKNDRSDNINLVRCEKYEKV